MSKDQRDEPNSTQIESIDASAAMPTSRIRTLLSKYWFPATTFLAGLFATNVLGLPFEGWRAKNEASIQAAVNCTTEQNKCQDWKENIATPRISFLENQMVTRDKKIADLLDLAGVIKHYPPDFVALQRFKMTIGRQAIVNLFGCRDDECMRLAVTTAVSPGEDVEVAENWRARVILMKPKSTMPNADDFAMYIGLSEGCFLQIGTREGEFRLAVERVEYPIVRFGLSTSPPAADSQKLSSIFSPEIVRLVNGPERSPCELIEWIKRPGRSTIERPARP